MLGYTESLLDGKYLADFYENETKFIYEEYEGEFLDNQYLIIRDFSGKVIAKYVWRDNRFIRLGRDNTPRVITARNVHQELAMEMLDQEFIKIKVLGGVGGAGKDFLMVNKAMELIRKGRFKKLVYVRNNIEVRHTNSLGALPGCEYDKMLPWLMPLADQLPGGVYELENLIQQDRLDIIHLGNIRGRDIKDSILYSTEAENLTRGHLKLLMTRVAEGSVLWLNGDTAQRDSAVFEKSEGLEHMVQKLSGQRMFGYVNLPTSERSEVARLAALLDD